MTPEKTFVARQVNTSNELYVVQPARHLAGTEQAHGEKEHAVSLDLASATTSITAAGQVASVLELQEVKYCAWELLRRRLSIWGDRDADSERGTANLKWLRRGDLFADIPLPTRDLESAWRDLCAVDGREVGGEECFRPSAVTARDVWRGVLTGCIANGVNVLSKLTMEQVVGAYDMNVGGKQAEQETGLVRAILTCLSERQGDGIQLNKQRCLRWTGAKFLQAMAEESDDIGNFEPIASGQISTKRFIGEWMDLLPEAWRTEAEIAKLGPQGDGRYQLEENGAELVYWYGIGKEEFLFGYPGRMDCTGSKTGTGMGVSAVSGKRKWHEKFKEQRDKKYK